MRPGSKGLFLSLTGGEALLHPSLEEFIRHASKAGMVVRIKSNGALLGQATPIPSKTPPVLDRLPCIKGTSPYFQGQNL